MAAMCKLWEGTPLEVLLRVIEDAFVAFGYQSAKDLQQQAVRLLLQGSNVLMSVPTGYGKSAVFYVLPECARLLLLKANRHVHRGCQHPCVLVVSPLISLMADQVAKLNKSGVAVAVQLGTDCHDVFITSLLVK